MSRNVFITGRGLVTPLGNGLSANLEALKAGRTGTVLMQEWVEKGLDVCVAGESDRMVNCPMFTVKNVRFMAPNARMAAAPGKQNTALLGRCSALLSGAYSAWLCSQPMAPLT